VSTVATVASAHRTNWRFTVCASLILAATSAALFLFRITQPSIYIFDEQTYIKAARAALSHTADANLEHPPLAKLLIAAGIFIFGDGAFGWRFMPALAGVFTVVAIYLLTLVLSRKQPVAILAAAFAVANNLLFVTSRTAALEPFVIVFIAWAALAAALAMRRVEPGASHFLLPLYACGALLGLALAVKWVALGAWLVCLAFLLVRAIQSRRGINVVHCLISLSAVTLIAYTAVFLLDMNIRHQPVSLQSLIDRHRLMVHFHQVFHVDAGLQFSRWWQWPFKVRPQYFILHKERSVELIGNPAVVWSGFVAACYVVMRWVRGRMDLSALSDSALLTAGLFFALWLQWSLATRQSFYHYYAPAALFLAPTLAIVLSELKPRRAFGMELRWAVGCLAALTFAICYPLLSSIYVPNSWFTLGH